MMFILFHYFSGKFSAKQKLIFSQGNCRGKKKIGKDITIFRFVFRGATDSSIRNWIPPIFGEDVGSMS